MSYPNSSADRPVHTGSHGDAGWVAVNARPAGRVVLADDDVLFREGLALLLGRSGFEVVGQAGDASELIGLVRQHLPDVVVADIRMPPSYSVEGLEIARVIRQEFPDTGIVILSAHAEPRHAMDLLSEGGRVGYVLKHRIADVDEIVNALERIGADGPVVDPEVVYKLIAADRANDPLARLSPRERDVLTLMAEGRSNIGIAHRLFVSEGTVEKHVRSLLAKLDLPTTSDDHRRVLAVLIHLSAR